MERSSWAAASTMLYHSVKEGRVAGTLALWHSMALMSMGGFDVAAARGMNKSTSRFFTTFDEHGHPVTGIRMDGVEEMVPLAHMVRRHGPCIAPIVPMTAEGTQALYQAPDPVTQPDLYQRHIQKMASKTARQHYNLMRAGFEPDCLERGVMSAYRT